MARWSLPPGLIGELAARRGLNLTHLAEEAGVSASTAFKADAGAAVLPSTLVKLSAAIKRLPEREGMEILAPHLRSFAS